MKKLILNNWHAKLISLLLATTLWYLIKKNVATTPSPSEVRMRQPTTEVTGAAISAGNARDFLLPSGALADNRETVVRAG